MHRRIPLRALVPVVTIAALLTIAPAALAAPAPCANFAQITDAAGDGHHPPTDILGAWWSEEAGRLQAVMRLRNGGVIPEHDDATTPGAEFIWLFSANAQNWYLRTKVALDTTAAHEWGSWAPRAGHQGPIFTPLGATPAVIERSIASPGLITIDVPTAAMGIAAGTRLTGFHTLTIDGISAEPTWVDRGPGGESETALAETSYGADYVVGSCGGPGGGTTDDGTPVIQGVRITAPTKVTKPGTIRITGSVVPAQANVPVTITRTTGRRSASFRTTTGADGTFVWAPRAFTESSDVRAAVGSLSSQSARVTVHSTTTARVRTGKTGIHVVSGRVYPGHDGRVLLLRSDAVTATRSAPVRNGQFSLRVGAKVTGRFQLVFIPKGANVERSTSNTIVLRAKRAAA